MTSRIKLRVSPEIALVLGILAASTSSIFIRFAQTDTPSLVIAAYRLMIATLILAPICLLRRRDEILRLMFKDWLLLALSGVFLGLHFATWITSLEYTSVASSVVLVTTTPLWVAVLSGFILKEKASIATWIGLAVAFAGCLLVANSRLCVPFDGGISCSGLIKAWQGGNLLGSVLALTGAVMAACYLLVGRWVRSRISFLTYIFTIYGFAAIVLVLLCTIFGDPLVPGSGSTWLWLILLAVFPQLLGHSSFNWAIRYLPAVFVSISLMGEPIGTIVLAFIFLHETPFSLEIIGGVLILLGILIASRPADKAKVAS